MTFNEWSLSHGRNYWYLELCITWTNTRPSNKYFVTKSGFRPVPLTSWYFLGLDGGAFHYDDVKMGTITSQITSLTIVYSTVNSGADQSKHQSPASPAFVWGIHRGPVNFPHKWPVTRKMFPFDDVIMSYDRHLKVAHSEIWSTVKSRVLAINTC